MKISTFNTLVPSGASLFKAPERRRSAIPNSLLSSVSSYLIGRQQVLRALIYTGGVTALNTLVTFELAQRMTATNSLNSWHHAYVYAWPWCLTGIAMIGSRIAARNVEHLQDHPMYLGKVLVGLWVGYASMYTRNQLVHDFLSHHVGLPGNLSWTDCPVFMLFGMLLVAEQHAAVF